MAYIQTPNAKLYKPDALVNKIDSQKIFIDNVNQEELNFTGLQDRIDELEAGVDKVGVDKDWSEFNPMLNGSTTDPDTMYFVDNINDGMLGGPVQMTKAEYTAYIAAQGTDQLNTLFYITDYNTGFTNAEIGAWAKLMDTKLVATASDYTNNAKLASNTLIMSREGNMVYLGSSFSTGSSTAIAIAETIMTVADNFRPASDTPVVLMKSGSGVAINAHINTLGQLQCQNNALDLNQWYSFAIMYFVKDTYNPTMPTVQSQSGAFIFNGKIYQGTSNNAANVGYDNSTSGLVSATLQAAIDELASWKKKAQKTGLMPKQNNSVTSMSGGVIAVPATNGTGVVFYVDQRVKTIRITATGAGFVCQFGMSAFTGSLPTLVTAGTDRASYDVVGGGSYKDFNWNGAAGLFYAACQGTVAGTITVEVVEYM